MDTPTAPHAAAELQRILNPLPRELAALTAADLAAEPHLTPLLRTLAPWLARHAAQSTRTTYAADITHYLLWLAATGQQPLHVTDPPAPGTISADTFTAYRHHLTAATDIPRTGSYSPATVRRKISAVSSFYTYAHTTQEIPRHPRDGYTHGTNAPAPVHLTPAHLAALIHAAEHPPPRSPTATRSPLLVRLLQTGARPREITHIEIRHLELTTEPPTLTIPRPRRTNGTLPPPHVLPLAPTAVTAIHAHLAAHPTGHHQLLITTTTGHPLTTREITEHIHALARRARIPRTPPDRIRLAFHHHAATTPPGPET